MEGVNKEDFLLSAINCVGESAQLFLYVFNKEQMGRWLQFTNNSFQEAIIIESGIQAY